MNAAVLRARDGWRGFKSFFLYAAVACAGFSGVAQGQPACVTPSASARAADCVAPRHQARPSAYLTKARQTRDFIAASLLTPYGSYRAEIDGASGFEWASASQIYADTALLRSGDTTRLLDPAKGFSWLASLWDGVDPAGGYLAAANLDGTGKGGGKFVDDNALTGVIYLEALATAVGSDRAAYLASAEAIAHWLMTSGEWDDTHGGGFWGNDSKKVKPTQSNGLALQLFSRLYKLTGRPDYRDWANAVRNWLETRMFDASTGLYVWEFDESGNRNNTSFTYDNAIMIEADLFYADAMNSKSYVRKAEKLAHRLNARLWNRQAGVYLFDTFDARVNPTWCVWASQALIHLYEVDHNAKWLKYARRNIDFMNTHLRNDETGAYYQWVNLDGSDVDPHIELVDQAWMERVQALMAAYR